MSEIYKFVRIDSRITLKNVCSVYRGGGVFSTMGDTISTLGDIMSALGGLQHIGGYHEYIRGCLVHWGYHECIGDIMNTSGDVQYIKVFHTNQRFMMQVEGYQ